MPDHVTECADCNLHAVFLFQALCDLGESQAGLLDGFVQGEGEFFGVGGVELELGRIIPSVACKAAFDCL